MLLSNVSLQVSNVFIDVDELIFILFVVSLIVGVLVFSVFVFVVIYVYMILVRLFKFFFCVLYFVVSQKNLNMVLFQLVNDEIGEVIVYVEEMMMVFKVDNVQLNEVVCDIVELIV